MATRETWDMETDREAYTADFLRSDADKVSFYDHPMIDNLVTTVLALSSEVWAGQRRMMVLERLLEDKGITKEMVESYMPSETEIAKWQAERDQFVDRTLSPLTRQASLKPSADWDDKG